MGDNVIQVEAFASPKMQTEARAGIEAAAVLANAVAEQGRLRHVIVFGVNDDGTLFGASTHAHMADTLLLMERVKRRLMDQFAEDKFA